jgi:hypothetical protein
VQVFKPATTIKKESGNSKDQNNEYKKKARQFIKNNPMCKVCGKPSESVHHQKGRVGDLLLDQRYWLALCIKCHQHFETHPQEAKKKGISISRLNNTS